jgi:hypothetical protein
MKLLKCCLLIVVGLVWLLANSAQSQHVKALVRGTSPTVRGPTPKVTTPSPTVASPTATLTSLTPETATLRLQFPFIRGDADGDCLVTVSDASFILCWYAQGGPSPPCMDAADATDDGIVNTGDAVMVINHVMLGGSIPPPFPNPGTDPTPDGLDCAAQCVSPTASTTDSLILPSLEASAGETIAVPVVVKNVQELLGYEVFVEHDSNLLKIISVDTTGTATGAAGPDMFGFWIHDDSLAVNIWCTIDCQQSVGIPAGRDTLVRIILQVDQNASCADSLLELKNVTGPPFWGNLLGYSGGKVYPTLATGNVELGPSPLVMSVADVGNDQGRQIRVNWNRSCLDGVGSPTTITEYGIWRRIGDETAHGQSSISMFDASRLYPPGDWDFVTTVPARGEAEYNTVCPTLGDSTQTGGMYWSVFFVSAMTSDPLVHFDSDPDSGYSLDNIPPLPISDFEIDPGSWFTLEWTVPGEYVGEEPISSYDIRYSTVPAGADTQAWWDNAVTCSGDEFFSFVVGERDSLQVADEAWHHPEVYLAIRGLDERPNASDISNIVEFICGDANASGMVEAGDIVYLISYLFRNGPAPEPMAKGDANCSGAVEAGDVVYLITYLFRNGPLPCSP